MQKQIKFIYALLIITVIGGGLIFILQNNINKFDSYISDSISNLNLKFQAFEVNGTLTDVDEIKNRIDNLIKNKVLREKKKEYKYDGPGVSSKIIYINEQGNISKYIKEVGSEDSFLIYNFYYDKNNKLFYALITGGASNGLDEKDKPISSELKHEIYFNSLSKVGENQDIISPGYSWPEVWPSNEIIFDPLKDFND